MPIDPLAVLSLPNPSPGKMSALRVHPPSLEAATSRAITPPRAAKTRVVVVSSTTPGRGASTQAGAKYTVQVAANNHVTGFHQPSQLSALRDPPSLAAATSRAVTPPKRAKSRVDAVSSITPGHGASLGTFSGGTYAMHAAGNHCGVNRSEQTPPTMVRQSDSAEQHRPRNSSGTERSRTRSTSALDIVLNNVRDGVDELLSRDLHDHTQGLPPLPEVVSEATVNPSDKKGRLRRALKKAQGHAALLGMLSEAQSVDREGMDRLRSELLACSSDGVHVSKDDFDRHFDKHDPLLKAQLWEHIKREDATATGNRKRVVSGAAIDKVSRLWAKSTNTNRAHQVDLLCQLLDHDHDGRVSRQEFVRFLAQASDGNLEVPRDLLCSFVT